MPHTPESSFPKTAGPVYPGQAHRPGSLRAILAAVSRPDFRYGTSPRIKNLNGKNPGRTI